MDGAILCSGKREHIYKTRVSESIPGLLSSPPSLGSTECGPGPSTPGTVAPPLAPGRLGTQDLRPQRHPESGPTWTHVSSSQELRAPPTLEDSTGRTLARLTCLLPLLAQLPESLPQRSSLRAPRKAISSFALQQLTLPIVPHCNCHS